MKRLAWLLVLALPSAVIADEGMWLFTNPPTKLLKEKYGFEPTKEWLEHVQKSSVRFNSGGSGSFVSPNGLVMTNHHVGADALAKFSDKDHDYLKDGFLARTQEEEKKCLDLELNVLQSIEDVTDQVNAAVKSDLSPAQAALARRAVIAQIQQDSLDKTGLRSDVVTLYQGGQYHLYRYKRYTDVRLVMAPEQQIAFFGGDPDNFEYPRYDLDVTFFRVYENDKPAKIEHYLKWSKEGAQENELIFVSGHPGRTSRLNTVDELEYMRDVSFPNLMERLYRMEVALKTWSERDEENQRRAKDYLFGVQNSRKARRGGLAGLLDPETFRSKKAAERKLRDAVNQNPELKDVVGAWDQIAKAQKITGEHATRYNALEREAGFNSTLFDLARTLVRAADELAKPNAERLPEFRESGMPSLKLQLFSEEALYADFEIVKLSDALTYLVRLLGYSDPTVQKVLAGKSPVERAAELVNGCKLMDVAERKRLFEGGKEAIKASKDPMILLAQLIDEESRAVRKIIEEQGEVKSQAQAKIAKARYKVEGDATYPDATFTLRLAFGTVKGFEENGKLVPFQTEIGGLYTRSAQHQNQPPFDLPARWVERKSQIDLKTPMNFVSTADIIGGNSGSPVINRNAEVVGLIFDGNIQSLVLDFAYSDTQARATSVHSRAIVESLKKVYDADRLLEELLGSK